MSTTLGGGAILEERYISTSAEAINSNVIIAAFMNPFDFAFFMDLFEGLFLFAIQTTSKVLHCLGDDRMRRITYEIYFSVADPTTLDDLILFKKTDVVLYGLVVKP